MTPAEAVAEIRKALRALSEMGELPDRFVHSSGIVIVFNTDLSAKRSAAGRKGGARSVETRREALGSAQPPKQTRSKPEASDSTDGSEVGSEATGAPSPTPPDSPSGSGSSSGDSSSLSALSEGPVSQRARRTKRARRAPSEWVCSNEFFKFGQKLGLELIQVSSELSKFRDHEFAAPRSDWDAAFRNWLRRAAEHATTQPRGAQADGVPIVQHRVFRDEPPVPASEKPSRKELESIMKTVGRQVGT